MQGQPGVTTQPPLHWDPRPGTISEDPILLFRPD